MDGDWLLLLQSPVSELAFSLPWMDVGMEGGGHWPTFWWSTSLIKAFLTVSNVSMLLGSTSRFGAQLDEPPSGLIVLFQEGILRLIDTPNCFET